MITIIDIALAKRASRRFAELLASAGPQGGGLRVTILLRTYNGNNNSNHDMCYHYDCFDKL